MTPAAGTTMVPGQTISFSGSATDADEVLPISALEWTVLLHHNEHIHVIQESAGASGSVTVEDHGTGTFSYEIILFATDSSGLTASKSVIFPVNGGP